MSSLIVQQTLFQKFSLKAFASVTFGLIYGQHFAAFQIFGRFIHTYYRSFSKSLQAAWESGKAASLVFQLVLISAIRSLGEKVKMKACQNLLPLYLWSFKHSDIFKERKVELPVPPSPLKTSSPRSLGFTWVQTSLEPQYLRRLAGILVPNQRAAAVRQLLNRTAFTQPRSIFTCG